MADPLTEAEIESYRKRLAPLRARQLMHAMCFSGTEADRLLASLAEARALLIRTRHTLCLDHSIPGASGCEPCVRLEEIDRYLRPGDAPNDPDHHDPR